MGCNIGIKRERAIELAQKFANDTKKEFTAYNVAGSTCWDYAQSTEMPVKYIGKTNVIVKPVIKIVEPVIETKSTKKSVSN